MRGCIVLMLILGPPSTTVFDGRLYLISVVYFSVLHPSLRYSFYRDVSRLTYCGYIHQA